MTTPIRTRKVSHVLLHVSDVERSVANPVRSHAPKP